MNNILNKEKITNFHDKKIKTLNVICSVMLILNYISKGNLSWLFRITFISLLLLNFIYFRANRRLLESIIVGILLITLLILYIALYFIAK